jgi:cytochrome c2
MREAQRAPAWVRAAFAALGLAFLAAYSWIYLGEQGAEWRRQQARFQQIQLNLKNPHQLAQAASLGGLRQTWLPDLDRVDRCTTCHLGIDDPAYAQAPQPFRSHPGSWLTSHPAERFGCTACHDGQGQATDYAGAAHAPIPFVERAMRPLETIEANCGRCHRSLEVPSAPRLSEGRRLIVESGCVSCHDIPGFEGAVFRGPALDGERDKVRPDWLAAWLKDPKSYLARSKMGNFRLSGDEVASLEAFILSQRRQSRPDQARVDWARADADKGHALFGELRCSSCHAVNGRGGTMGPELTKIGDKVRRDWLFSFLKDPHADQPDTPMLQYRLTDDQVRDLAAYLLQEFRSGDAAPETAPASFQDPRMVAAGRAAFIKHGCYGCHQLPGVAAQGKIGPSLAGVADHDPDQLSYGSFPARHTTDNYLFLKLLHPDSLGSPSIMPTFAFTPSEAATITIALSGLRKADLPTSRVIWEPPARPYQPQGRFGELATRYRCLSCHSIGGTGGRLSTVPLDRIGSQLQRTYLASYLLNPGAVRVSVEARMPVFHMLPDEAAAIADYAASVLLDDALDRYDARFTPADERKGQALFASLGCIGCHQIGTTGGYVGPDLSNTGKRLKPGWIAAWLSDPQRAKPGTTQPNYGLSAADVRALTAYLSRLGAAPGASPSRDAAAIRGGGRP